MHLVNTTWSKRNSHFYLSGATIIIFDKQIISSALEKKLNIFTFCELIRFTLCSFYSCGRSLRPWTSLEKAGDVCCSVFASGLPCAGWVCDASVNQVPSLRSRRGSRRHLRRCGPSLRCNNWHWEVEGAVQWQWGVCWIQQQRNAETWHQHRLPGQWSLWWSFFASENRRVSCSCCSDRSCSLADLS